MKGWTMKFSLKIANNINSYQFTWFMLKCQINIEMKDSQIPECNSRSRMQSQDSWRKCRNQTRSSLEISTECRNIAETIPMITSEWKHWTLANWRHSHVKIVWKLQLIELCRKIVRIFINQSEIPTYNHKWSRIECFNHQSNYTMAMIQLKNHYCNIHQQCILLSTESNFISTMTRSIFNYWFSIKVCSTKDCSSLHFIRRTTI